MKINDYYKTTFFTPGKTADDFILEGCTHEFMKIALRQLETSPSHTIAIDVTFDAQKVNEDLQKIFEKYPETTKKAILAHLYLENNILSKLLTLTKIKTELTQKDVQKNLFIIHEAENIGALFGAEMKKNTKYVLEKILQNNFES
jgi:hypothetical protein